MRFTRATLVRDGRLGPGLVQPGSQQLGAARGRRLQPLADHGGARRLRRLLQHDRPRQLHLRHGADAGRAAARLPQHLLPEPAAHDQPVQQHGRAAARSSSRSRSSSATAETMQNVVRQPVEPERAAGARLRSWWSTSATWARARTISRRSPATTTRSPGRDRSTHAVRTSSSAGFSIRTRSAAANYHALQLKAERRLQNGFTVLTRLHLRQVARRHERRAAGRGRHAVCQQSLVQHDVRVRALEL